MPSLSGKNCTDKQETFWYYDCIDTSGAVGNARRRSVGVLPIRFRSVHNFAIYERCLWVYSTQSHIMWAMSWSSFVPSPMSWKSEGLEYISCERRKMMHHFNPLLKRRHHVQLSHISLINHSNGQEPNGSWSSANIHRMVFIALV